MVRYNLRDPTEPPVSDSDTESSITHHFKLALLVDFIKCFGGFFNRRREVRHVAMKYIYLPQIVFVNKKSDDLYVSHH